MKIFISDLDKYNAFRVPLVTIAKFYKIPDWEYDLNDTLFLKLRSINPPSSIIKPLEEYFKAYENWFSFYKKRKEIEEKTDQEYILNEDEKKEISELIKKRQIKLAELQRKFDELQVTEMHKQMGIPHIKGTITHE